MIWWIVGALVVGLPLAVALTWYQTNTNMFKGSVRRGESYQMGDRMYRMPDLPIVDSSGRSMEALPLIDPEYNSLLRILLQRVNSVLKHRHIEHFVSGGTLLGMVRHGSFLGFDDDADFHLTNWNDRYYAWSQDFVDDCDTVDVEVFHLRWGSLEYAPKFGNATGIRCRLKGFKSPTLDIFFEKEIFPGTMAKIESWSGDDVEVNHREIWSKSDVLPIQWKIIDGMDIPIPANPEALLKTQYGNDCLDVIRFDGIFWSHAFFFKILTPIWKIRTPSNMK